MKYKITIEVEIKTEFSEESYSPEMVKTLLLEDSKLFFSDPKHIWVNSTGEEEIEGAKIDHLNRISMFELEQIENHTPLPESNWWVLRVSKLCAAIREGWKFEDFHHRRAERLKEVEIKLLAKISDLQKDKERLDWIGRGSDIRATIDAAMDGA
jgi:hypothetical protein